MQENRPGGPRLGLASVSQSDPEPGDERKAFPARKAGFGKRLNTAGKMVSGPLFEITGRCCCGHWCLTETRKPAHLGCVFPRAHFIPDLYRARGAKLWPLRAPTKACCAYTSYDLRNVKAFLSLVQNHAHSVHKWVLFCHTGILGRINSETSEHTSVGGGLGTMQSSCPKCMNPSSNKTPGGPRWQGLCHRISVCGLHIPGTPGFYSGEGLTSWAHPSLIGWPIASPAAGVPWHPPGCPVPGRKELQAQPALTPWS